ncbi:hypothetical protein J437_LFUL012685, partial [Ladona fulva]
MTWSTQVSCVKHFFNMKIKAGPVVDILGDEMTSKLRDTSELQDARCEAYEAVLFEIFVERID